MLNSFYDCEVDTLSGDLSQLALRCTLQEGKPPLQNLTKGSRFVLNSVGVEETPAPAVAPVQEEDVIDVLFAGEAETTNASPGSSSSTGPLASATSSPQPSTATKPKQKRDVFASESMSASLSSGSKTETEEKKEEPDIQSSVAENGSVVCSESEYLFPTNIVMPLGKNQYAEVMEDDKLHLLLYEDRDEVCHPVMSTDVVLKYADYDKRLLNTKQKFILMPCGKKPRPAGERRKATGWFVWRHDNQKLLALRGPNQRGDFYFVMNKTSMPLQWNQRVIYGQEEGATVHYKDPRTGFLLPDETKPKYHKRKTTRTQRRPASSTSKAERAAARAAAREAKIAKQQQDDETIIRNFRATPEALRERGLPDTLDAAFNTKNPKLLYLRSHDAEDVPFYYNLHKGKHTIGRNRTYSSFGRVAYIKVPAMKSDAQDQSQKDYFGSNNDSDASEADSESDSGSDSDDEKAYTECDKAERPCTQSLEADFKDLMD
jgi:hypothetical protein